MPSLDNPMVAQLLADRSALERASSRIEHLSQQLGETAVANDELRTQFTHLSDQRDAVVRQNAALKLELARSQRGGLRNSADGGLAVGTAAAPGSPVAPQETEAQRTIRYLRAKVQALSAKNPGDDAYAHLLQALNDSRRQISVLREDAQRLSLANSAAQTRAQAKVCELNWRSEEDCTFEPRWLH